MSIKVSIGMPVYNGERWIEKAIMSFTNQTFHDFELIIANNNSTDRTHEICEYFKKKDTRIRYYRNSHNIGIANNYNKVFEVSNGEYFKWTSVSDLCDPTFLEKCIKVLEEHSEVVLCYPRTLLVLEEGKMIPYEDNLNLQDEDPCIRYIKFIERIKLNNVMNGLIRSDCLKKTQLNKDYISEDINFTAELTLYGKFYELPEYLFYRNHTEGTTSALKSKEDIIKNFNRNKESEMFLQEWKYQLAFYTGVYRSPLTAYQKSKLFLYLLKRTRYSRVELFKDLIYYMNSVIRK